MQLSKLLVVLFCIALTVAKALEVANSAEALEIANSATEDLENKTVPSVSSGPQSRIVSGANAAAGQFPYQVSLYIDGEFICGGSIVGPKHVLTAAHCVHDGNSRKKVPASRITIRAGSLTLFYGGQLVGVSSVKVHPDFSVYESDLAVLKLSRSLLYNTDVQPIDLAHCEPPAGDYVLTSGWGRITDGGPLSPNLQYIFLAALSSAQCTQLLGSLPPFTLCLAHLPGSGVCRGDSGGPAVYKNLLVGVTSFTNSIDCASGFPDGFVSVAAHRDWIEKQLRH